MPGKTIATQWEERKAAAQEGDPRPCEGCSWCCPGCPKAGNPKGDVVCDTCFLLADEHGWAAVQWGARRQVYYAKQRPGRKQLRIDTAVEFIRVTSESLFPIPEEEEEEEEESDRDSQSDEEKEAGTDGEEKSSEDGERSATAGDDEGEDDLGDWGGGEGNNNFSNDAEEMAPEGAAKSAGEKGKKRRPEELESDSDVEECSNKKPSSTKDSEGEGSNKMSSGTGGSLSPVGGGGGQPREGKRARITLKNDDSPSSDMGMLSLSDMYAYEERLVKKGYSRADARAKVTELGRERAERVAMQNHAISLQYALEDADEYRRSKIDPEVEKLERETQEARTIVACGEATLNTWKGVSNPPLDLDGLVATMEEKRKVESNNAKETKRLKRSAGEMFDKLHEEGKEMLLVSHGTPQNSRDLFDAVRAQEFGEDEEDDDAAPYCVERITF